MRGTVYRQCWCRDPETGRKLHTQCPDLGKKGHGAWYFRYEAPRARGEKRRQPVGGPFPAKKLAEDELAAALAKIGGGGSAPDRALRVAAYLQGYQAAKVNQKQRTRETDDDAFRLYWIPALGHLRVVEVRKRHVEEAVQAMMAVNRPPPAGEKPPEMLRRMMAARADDERRVLPEGEERHKKAARPLSAARIGRMYAPFRAAMRAAVPSLIGVSPCDGVELPRADAVKPLAWTPPREAKFRAALDAKERAATAVLAEGRVLTGEQRQAAWASPGLRPARVMVWMPEHCEQFLAYLDREGDRLAALFTLTAFCGLRRDEATGLAWAEADLDQGVAYIRETGSGGGPKSEAGVRAVPLPVVVVSALRAWRRAQAAERLAWGPAWQDTGLVFTHEDGTGLSGQWVSRRFAVLAFRSGLPPVRFHDLRHVAASLLKAAGIDTKVISAVLGHSRTSFTDSTYVLLFPDVAKDAMDAAAAVVLKPAGRQR